MVLRLLVLCCCFLVSCMVMGQEKKVEWNLLKDKGTVKIYNRMKSDGFQEYKGVVSVSADVEKIISLIRNDKKGVKWINRAVDFKTVGELNDTEWYTYTEIDIPFPFDNKDLVSLNKLEHQSLDSALINMVSEPTYLPEYKDKARIEHMEASWYAVRQDSETTRLEYRVVSHKQILPLWISQPLVSHSLYKTLEAFKKLVEKK